MSLTWRQSKRHGDSDSAEETLLGVLVGSEHLDAQRGLSLFEQEVPDVQHTLHLHSEEDRRSHWTPAGVHQVGHLVPGAQNPRGIKLKSGI